jgi:hypothetical protein
MKKREWPFLDRRTDGEEWPNGRKDRRTAAESAARQAHAAKFTDVKEIFQKKKTPLP